jgi:hypothetical protein
LIDWILSEESLLMLNEVERLLLLMLLWILVRDWSNFLIDRNRSSDLLNYWLSSFHWIIDWNLVQQILRILNLLHYLLQIILIFDEELITLMSILIQVKRILPHHHLNIRQIIKIMTHNPWGICDWIPLLLLLTTSQSMIIRSADLLIKVTLRMIGKSTRRDWSLMLWLS